MFGGFRTNGGLKSGAIEVDKEDRRVQKRRPQESQYVTPVMRVTEDVKTMDEAERLKTTTS